MKLLTVSHSEVTEILTMEKCIPVMRKALIELAEEKSSMPLRTVNVLPDSAKNGILATMPAFLTSEKIMGLKIISVFPGNFGTGYESHQGTVMLFDTEHGGPLAIIDAASITGIRTAAVSAVATDLLANINASTLALIGSGVQAVAHLKALSLVRKIKEVRVCSVPYEHARQFATREALKYAFPIHPCESTAEAVKNADIVCTLTPSKDPVLFGKDLSPGVHINAIGACSPDARELDTEAVVGSRLFVDLKVSALKEAGDFLIPKAEGIIDESHILAEIGDLLFHNRSGRTSECDRTLYKSLGLAVEDIAAANFVYREALKLKKGTFIDL